MKSHFSAVEVKGAQFTLVGTSRVDVDGRKSTAVKAV
jgi:hypothetical protein